METVTEVSRSTWDVLVELQQKRLKCQVRFRHEFNVSLHKFWRIEIGFDLVAFDQWLKTPDGKSTREWIEETHGAKAAQLIESLL